MVLLFVYSSSRSPVQVHYVKGTLRYYRSGVHMGPFTYFSELVISLWQSVSGPHPLLWYHWLQAYHFYVALFILCLPFTQHRVTRCTHPWCDQLLCWLSLSSAGNQVPPPLSNGRQASDVRAACSLDQLHVNAKEYFCSGLADFTHRTYGAAQRQFLSFCDNYGIAPLPASEDTLILSVTSLAARIKPQSINVYLAGVRSLHVSNGYDNPLTPGLRLKQTLRGTERNHFAPPKRKMPITFDLPCKIHVFVNFRSNDDIVYWAAITWGHFFLLSAGEFTLCNKERFDLSRNLALGDVTSHQSPDGQHYWMVHIKQSKSDQRPAREWPFIYSHTPFSLPSLRNEI